MAKLSGIGCSSKTPAYFLKEAHGFNAVHGRMPSIGTGASAANRDLMLIGVSGDGDSLSIGLGQFCHAIRRNVNVLYILENNGVYGLTKGQFSASADMGSKPKKGEAESPAAHRSGAARTDPGRDVRGAQLHWRQGPARADHPGRSRAQRLRFHRRISPCVTFNDHEGSTKSYQFTRQRAREVVSRIWSSITMNRLRPTWCRCARRSRRRTRPEPRST